MFTIYVLSTQKTPYIPSTSDPHHKRDKTAKNPSQAMLTKHKRIIQEYATYHTPYTLHIIITKKSPTIKTSSFCHTRLFH